MSVAVDTIYATGGAAANDRILQVMADVFGADVYRSAVGNSAALGAALRAWHADALDRGRPLSWDHITQLARPGQGMRVAPDRGRHAVYQELLPTYEAYEARALAQGAR
jgi:sugar (pentulose or hexulose) kinase